MHETKQIDEELEAALRALARSPLMGSVISQQIGEALRKAGYVEQRADGLVATEKGKLALRRA